MNPNLIKKNDWILVKRESGEKHLGRATKVAPWNKNPKVTVVHWINVEETYKFTADARNCSLAPESMKPLAKVFPDAGRFMAGWTLGKMKRGPQMMEGYYFASPVLLHGKKVGEIIDAGNGGPVMTRFKDHTVAKTFEGACDKWCLDNGADGRYSDGHEHFWSWWEEGRYKGIDPKTFFKAEKEDMSKFMAGV
jgi:hypothetical protein